MYHRDVFFQAVWFILPVWNFLSWDCHAKKFGKISPKFRYFSWIFFITVCASHRKRSAQTLKSRQQYVQDFPLFFSLFKFFNALILLVESKSLFRWLTSLRRGIPGISNHTGVRDLYILRLISDCALCIDQRFKGKRDTRDDDREKENDERENMSKALINNDQGCQYLSGSQ